MRTLFPAASACLVVAFVATVGYAESQIESSERIENEDPVEKKAQHELSVAPMEHVTYPDDRPGWVDAEPDLKSPVHTWVVVTSGSETIEQSEAELDVLKRATVALYIRETTGWNCDEAFLDGEWIENDLIARRYVGKLDKGDHELFEIAVELQFDAKSRERIDRAKKNLVVDQRIRATGGLFALALIGLCCTGGLLGVMSRRYA